jgi:hypothetical protein
MSDVTASVAAAIIHSHCTYHPVPSNHGPSGWGRRFGGLPKHAIL